MSRYVSPDRRRRRRQVDGPQGEEPAEFQPQRVVRVMRCPKCRQTIGTMRRWRLACPECGHEWEEASERTAADKLADARGAAGEYALMGLMWAGLIAIPIGLVALAVYIGMRLTGGNIFAAIFVILFGVGSLYFFGNMERSRSNDTPARFVRWRRGERDGP